MEQNETRIKIEGEILSLKRELKYATEQVSRLKADTAEIIATKEKITKEITERNEELTRVLNDISDEKLKWALERQKHLDEIAEKNSQADNILKRKAELNKQEETIRKIEANDIEIRNEARRLELKNEQEKTALEVRFNEIETYKKGTDVEREKISKDRENFKNEVLKVMKAVEKL